VAELPLLRIGAFSRASSLSVKALRLYHEIGLLVPAIVDPASGYRSYSVAQLMDAAVIRRLRQLDVPLEGVRAVVDARDPAVTRKVLAEHAALLEERVAAMERAIAEVYAAVETAQVQPDVIRRHEPARTVLTLPGRALVPELEAFVRRAAGMLLEAAVASGAVIDDAFGACFPTLLDDDAQDVVAFLPVAAPVLLTVDARAAGVRVDELPATDVAVFEHRGSYEGLEDAYLELGAWVAVHADAADLPVRELYVVTPQHVDADDLLRTQILWPLQSGDTA
jgi:DNA-binding transcriptional MerR regulator